MKGKYYVELFSYSIVGLVYFICCNDRIEAFDDDNDNNDTSFACSFIFIGDPCFFLLGQLTVVFTETLRQNEKYSK